MFEEAGFNLQLAINVPVRALFTLPIARLVADYRPRAERWPGLIVEVTEDQLVREAALAQDVAAQFRVSGILIAIDEFGAGFSSFGRLRDLPFAELKIDRRFVQHCATDAADAAICQTAVDLAHRFGASVVAEGVEKCGRPAGADGDGLRLRTGRGDSPADAQGAVRRAVAPAPR